MKKNKGEKMNTGHSGKTINVVIAGVGGQGSITSGQIAARAAMLHGTEVAMSEVHGMAQRGGSVMSTVRYGSNQSPVIPMGEADFLLGFESLEALRYSPYLRSSGVAIVSDQRIIPTIEALKKATYPTNIFAELKIQTKSAIFLPALEIAAEIGNPRLIGSVLLGAFSAFMDFSASIWKQAITDIVPHATIERNLQAFRAGYEFTIDADVLSAEKPVTVNDSVFITA
ncbi:MAG: indolepyruvate oxidoreductase subunit beta [Deltaproteobacteria bacterium]|nr:indolepyruvate oxidoreductase subunit beta [Deltaproteobacteria bacterium]